MQLLQKFLNPPPESRDSPDDLHWNHLSGLEIHLYRPQHLEVVFVELPEDVFDIVF